MLAQFLFHVARGRTPTFSCMPPCLLSFCPLVSGWPESHAGPAHLPFLIIPMEDSLVVLISLKNSGVLRNQSTAHSRKLLNLDKKAHLKE